jgi:hypothetical protein
MEEGMGKVLGDLGGRGGRVKSERLQTQTLPGMTMDGGHGHWVSYKRTWWPAEPQTLFPQLIIRSDRYAAAHTQIIQNGTSGEKLKNKKYSGRYFSSLDFPNAVFLKFLLFLIFDIQLVTVLALVGCAVAQYGHGHGYSGYEPGYAGHGQGHYQGGYAGHGHGRAYAVAPVVKAALPVVAKTVDYDVSSDLACIFALRETWTGSKFSFSARLVLPFIQILLRSLRCSYRWPKVSERDTRRRQSDWTLFIGWSRWGEQEMIELRSFS